VKKKMSQNEELPGLIKLLSHRILFILHLFAYGAVSLLLILIWAVSLPLAGFFYFTPFFPIFGWGFGMGFHAIVYLMFNDKVKYLSEIRKQIPIKILFIFHAWFYASINIFLLILDLTTPPGLIWSYWPLAMWGIAFAFHAYGFFTWDKSYEKEMLKFREMHPDYSEKRLKSLITSKLLGFVILLTHITYFVLVNIIMYTTGIIYGLLLMDLLRVSFGWGIFFIVHVLGFYLFTYNKTIKSEMKGLIIHLILYVGYSVWGLFEQIVLLQEPGPMQNIFWWHIPVILWAIFIVIHVLVTLRWDKIKPSTLEKVKSRSAEDLEDFEFSKRANWLIFWNWSFIAHIFIYILGIILLGIEFSTYGVSLLLLVIIALGWFIGLLVHGGIYYIALKNITGFLMWTAILHIAAYIGGIPLLITINMIYSPEFLWSAIALGGWAIGLGAHLLIAFLTKKK
jgi:hypothetical protein